MIRGGQEKISQTLLKVDPTKPFFESPDDLKLDLEVIVKNLAASASEATKRVTMAHAASGSTGGDPQSNFDDDAHEDNYQDYMAWNDQQMQGEGPMVSMLMGQNDGDDGDNDSTKGTMNANNGEYFNPDVETNSEGYCA